MVEYVAKKGKYEFMEKNYDVGKEFDDIALEYDEDLKELAGFLGNDIEKFAEYKVQVTKMIVPSPYADKQILDFGCGTGRSLQYFKKLFPDAKLSGCDVSEKSLQVARRVAPYAYFFCNSDVESLYIQKKQYDMVFLACVMHHIEPIEREKWIRAIGDSMNHDGYLVIFEHNLMNPMTKKIVTDPLNKADRLEWMLSSEELVKCAESSHPDLRLYWKGYTLFSPWRWNGLVNIERFLKWLPMGAQHCAIFKKNT